MMLTLCSLPRCAICGSELAGKSKFSVLTFFSCSNIRCLSTLYNRHVSELSPEEEQRITKALQYLRERNGKKYKERGLNGAKTNP